MIDNLPTRLLKLAVVATCCLAWSSSPVVADVVTFEWATVGNPNNAGEVQTQGTFGAVSNTYRISKHEVTNNQYACFLNNVAATDSNNLYNPNMGITQGGSSGSYTYSVNAGLGARPINYVSYFDAMRFTNWLHNGQGMGDTESGVYNIGNGVNETRATGARYFIPSENEWYKAAYHDPRSAAAGGPAGDDNYWLYPTRSDTGPTAEAPPGGVNSANVNFAVGDTTNVGAYGDSTSFYGTLDQGGNVSEWNEAVLFSTSRGLRGGSWRSNSGDFGLASSSQNDRGVNSSELNSVGFRVASQVPEPSTLLLAALGTIGVLLRRRR